MSEELSNRIGDGFEYGILIQGHGLRDGVGGKRYKQHRAHNGDDYDLWVVVQNPHFLLLLLLMRLVRFLDYM